MTNEPFAIEHVEARRVLLDVLDALIPHLNAAQAGGERQLESDTQTVPGSHGEESPRFLWRPGQRSGRRPLRSLRPSHGILTEEATLYCVAQSHRQHLRTIRADVVPNGRPARSPWRRVHYPVMV